MKLFYLGLATAAYGSKAIELEEGDHVAPAIGAKCLNEKACSKMDLKLNMRCDKKTGGCACKLQYCNWTPDAGCATKLFDNGDCLVPVDPEKPYCDRFCDDCMSIEYKECVRKGEGDMEKCMCQCAKGYEPRKDECVPIADMCPDDVVEMCMQRLGEFGTCNQGHCECMDGYVLNIKGQCAKEEDQGCQSNKDCGPNETCEKNLNAPNTCRCKDGFKFNKETEKCTRMCGVITYGLPNEEPTVTSNYGFCAPDASCVVKETAVEYDEKIPVLQKKETCVCNDGYSGDGYKECFKQDDDCDCNCLCQKKMGSANARCDKNGDCHCNPMFVEKKGQCVPYLECMSDADCEENGEKNTVCRKFRNPKTDDVYTKCVCDRESNFYLDSDGNCQVDIGECKDKCDCQCDPKTSKCDADEKGRPFCRCRDGFENVDEFTCVKEEEPIECPNHFSCGYDGTSFPKVPQDGACHIKMFNVVCQKNCCVCRKGFNDGDGNFKNGCEEKDDPCAVNKCHAEATCYRKTPFEIEDHEKPKFNWARAAGPEAVTDDKGVAPISDTDEYVCECNKGWEGNGVICHKIDVNQCDKTDLCKNGECINLNPGYKCECHDNFRSKGPQGPCLPIEEVGNCDAFEDANLLKMGYTPSKVDFDMQMRTASMVVQTAAFKKMPLQKNPYCAFMVYRAGQCGASFMKAFASNEIKFGISDFFNKKVKEPNYKIVGQSAIFYKTPGGSNLPSAGVVQFCKLFNTFDKVNELFENGDIDQPAGKEDAEINQVIKEKDGEFIQSSKKDSFKWTMHGAGAEDLKENESCLYPTMYVYRTKSAPYFLPMLEDFTGCWIQHHIDNKIPDLEDIVCKENAVDKDDIETADKDGASVLDGKFPICTAEKN